MTEKWTVIASSIEGAIRRGELQPGQRIGSETELASTWRVSPVTIQRALSELQREGWVLRRPKIGTIVADRSAQSRKVALLVSSAGDATQSSYISGLTANLGDDLELVTINTQNSATLEADALRRAAAECRAIVCSPTGAVENSPLFKSIATTVPIVFIDRALDGVDGDVIMTDNLGSIDLGLRHLASLGHSRIAYFMLHPQLTHSATERYKGYVQFMASDTHVRQFSRVISPEQHYVRVETVLAEMLRDPKPITAIVCEQDSVMAAVLEAAIHLGISVPGELAILSFNDVPVMMQPLARTVHRLVPRPEALGAMAAERVRLRLIDPTLPSSTTRLVADLHPATRYEPGQAVKDFVASRLSLLLRRSTE